jgi:uncharacterized protein
MRQVLADTSALIALADADDVAHRAVSSYVTRHCRLLRLVVTSYVFDECMTVMKTRFGSQAAVAFGERLRGSSFCQLLHLTVDDETATWQVFTRYADKDWSYTDCSSLAVMRRLGIEEALATDVHFRQMGVTVLP